MKVTGMLTPLLAQYAQSVHVAPYTVIAALKNGEINYKYCLILGLGDKNCLADDRGAHFAIDLST